MFTSQPTLRWQMNDTDPTEAIRATISFLAVEPTVAPPRIGTMGSSYGGGLVTYIASTDPRVKGVIAQVSSKASRIMASSAKVSRKRPPWRSRGLRGI